MANRKKPTDLQFTTAIQIRTTPAFKARLDTMAAATGEPISETGRKALEAIVSKWEKQNNINPTSP